MEDLIEHLIAYLLRSPQFDQRKRQPFSEDWNVSGTEDRERVRLHLLHIFLDQSRIVVGAGAVRAGNQDQLRFG
jgi:hypothetical protein